jgi:hypothetical protein
VQLAERPPVTGMFTLTLVVYECATVLVRGTYKIHFMFVQTPQKFCIAFCKETIFLKKLQCYKISPYMITRSYIKWYKCHSWLVSPCIPHFVSTNGSYVAISHLGDLQWHNIHKDRTVDAERVGRWSCKHMACKTHMP